MAAHIEWDRKTYLAYECKRLNVVNDSKWKSLATPYVKEGVVRFVKEQYSEGLPVGCMLGYVLDGDVGKADPRIRAAMTKHATLTAMESGFKPLLAIAQTKRFATAHKRPNSGTLIEVRHALVACT